MEKREILATLIGSWDGRREERVVHFGVLIFPYGNITALT